jgi:hypothetical protein
MTKLLNLTDATFFRTVNLKIGMQKTPGYLAVNRWAASHR